MKKFYKYAGIFAGVFFGIGLIFVIIGAAMGAQGAIALTLKDGFKIIEDYEVWEHRDMDMEAFGSIYIETKTADIDIVTSPDGKYGVDISLMGDDSSIEFENKDGVLTLKDSGDNVGFVISLTPWKASSDNQITIYVPEDVKLTSVDMSCNVGDINVEKLAGADKLKVVADTGDVDINDGVYQNVSVEVAVGDVAMEDMEICESLVATMDVGDLDVSGLIEGNIEATVNVGDIDMVIGGENSNYKYTLSTNAGDIEIFGKEYEGIDRDVSGNPNGKYIMNVKVDLGSITIE